MRERRSVDRGIENRRVIEPWCESLPSETLARYLTRADDTAERRAVEEHLHGCQDCWAVLETTYKLFAAH